jgi:hypothetical protein
VDDAQDRVGVGALLTALWITRRNSSDQTTLRETLRLLPDVVRLLRRLATDPDLPRGVRVRLYPSRRRRRPG